jgi:hypothetical protein
MAIAKAEILAEVNANTERAETSIDTELLKVLLDISSRGAFFPTQASGTLAGDTDIITRPTDAAVIEYIHFPDDAVLLPQITFAEYQQQALEGYAERGDTLYISPKSSSSRSYTIYYNKKHDEDVENIEFGEEAREAIVAGVCAKVLRKYSRFDVASAWELIYESEIRKLVDNLPDDPPITRLRMN